MGDDLEKAKWLLQIANGICFEEVAQKGNPTSAMRIKTFNKVYKFKDLEKFITLCIIDVIQKIQDYMEDFKIFPTKLVINFKNNKDAGRAKS